MKRSILAVLLLAACATTQETVKPAPAVEAPKAPDAGPSAPPAAQLPAPAPTAPVPPRPFPAQKPMEVVRIPIPNKPIVSIRLAFRTGSIDDPKGKEGLTALTAAILEQGGTKELSSSQLLEALYPMAGELSFSIDKELTVVSGRVHKDHLDRFLKILTDVLLEPRFDPKEFERLRNDQLNQVKNSLRNEDDETLGKVALDALLYAGHPYGHFVGGTVAGIGASTLDDVKAHWKNVFTQDRLIIGLGGAVDGTLEQKLMAKLAQLPATGAPRVELPAAPGVHGKVVIIRKPTLSTAISMGSTYEVRRGDPDFFPLFFAMSYLGEHRQSNGVLFNQLRELRGLNYGDYAYAENFIQAGYSSLPAPNTPRATQHYSLWIRPVEPKNAVFAVRGAQHFFQELIDHGIPQDRFEISRAFLDGFTRLWAQTDQRRLGYAIDSRLYGTPDFLEAYRAALKTLTPDQVQAAVKRHFAVDALNYAFVTQDADALKDLLVRQPPTPLEYKSPKPPEVLELDKTISSAPIPLDPASIQIVDAQEFMAQ